MVEVRNADGRARLPNRALVQDSATLRHTSVPGLGRVAVAACDVPRGAVLIHESPTFAVPAAALLPKAERRALRSAYRELGVPSEQMLQAHALVHAPKSVRDAVLNHFCTYGALAGVDAPVAGIDGGGQELREGASRVSDASDETRGDAAVAAAWEGATHSARRVAEWFAARYDLAARGTSTNELVTLLGCIELNTHDVSSAAGGKYVCAMFANGARLTHACVAPNTVYHCCTRDGASTPSIAEMRSRRGGGGDADDREKECDSAAEVPCEGEATGVVGQHRALRDIAAGELLTSDYLGPAGIASARLRRTALAESKLFWCTCPACTTERDAMRALPCPMCGPARDAANGLLRTDECWDEVADRWRAHALTDDRMITPPPGGGGAEVGAAWRCESCDAEVPMAVLADMLVQGEPILLRERALEDAVYALSAELEDAPRGERRDALQARVRALLHPAHRTLGARHWVSVSLRSMVLEDWLSVAAHAEVEDINYSDSDCNDLRTHETGVATRAAYRARLVALLRDAGYGYDLGGPEAFALDVYDEFIALREWYHDRGFVALELGRTSDVLDLITSVGADAAAQCTGLMKVLHDALESARCEFGGCSDTVSAFARDCAKLEGMIMKESSNE